MPRREPHRRATHGLGLVLCALLLAPGATGEEAEQAEATPPLIYKWVDENGIAHYTTDRGRIPAELRGQLGGPRGLNEPGAERSGPGHYSASDSWVLEDARRSVDPYAIRFPGDEDFEGGTVAPGYASEADREFEREIEERISAVRAEIERDQEILKTLLSAPASDAASDLADQPEFREIAQRLPKLQANLRALRKQRRQPQESREPEEF